MVKKTPKYKTMPMKKIGKEYWRIWGRVGTKRLADWEKEKVKKGGNRVRVEKKGSEYWVWYLPHTQDMAKRDYERFKRGE